MGVARAARCGRATGRWRGATRKRVAIKLESLRPVLIGGVAFPQRIRTPTGRLDLLAGVQQPETGGDQAGRRATAARPHARDRAAEKMVTGTGLSRRHQDIQILESSRLSTTIGHN